MRTGVWKRRQDLLGRIAEGLIGLVSIGVSIVVLANPLLPLTTLIYLVAATVGLDALLALITGGLRAVGGARLELHLREAWGWIRRLGRVGIGLLVAGLVVAVVLDPKLGAETLLTLLLVGVGILGAMRVIRGVVPGGERFLRGLTILTGGLAVLAALLVLIVPDEALATLAIVIAVAMLLQGVQSVISGLRPTDPRQIVLLRLILFSLFYGLVMINWIDLFGKQVPGYGIWLVITYFAPFWVLLEIEGYSEWLLAISLGLLVSLANDVGYFFVGNLLFGFHENLGPWILGQLGLLGNQFVTQFEAGVFSIRVDSWMMGVSIYLRALVVGLGLYYWWTHPSRLLARIEPPAAASPETGVVPAP